MDHKFKFVIVSKDTTFMMDSKCFAGLDNVAVEHIADNHEPLAKVYNRQLAAVREKHDFDFIVFMHADATIDVAHFVKHLGESSQKYDVFGLCGTEVINVSQTPLNWYTGSRLNVDKRWGCVTHVMNGMQKAFFSQDRAAVTDHEVACIDGVCIAFGPHAIADSELAFDEKFTYDFYDTDISFQCLVQRHLRIGVLVEPSLVHNSIGKSIMADEFLAHEIDFREKWNLLIPNDQRIQMIYKILRPSTS